MSSQEDTVAEHNNSHNSIVTSTSTSTSFTCDDVYALLDTNSGHEAESLISAIKKLVRGTKMAQKNVKALDTLCNRLLATVTAVPTLSTIVERLDAIDAKISAPTVVTPLTYAAAAARAPTEAPPKRTRTDEVTIKIVRNTEAEAKAKGTGEKVQGWVEGAMQGSGVKGLSNVEVAGVQPHRSGTKITVRFRSSDVADKVVRNAAQCSSALGAGAKISVPHYGVVIQDVPLFYDPSKETYRRDLHAQNPSLIPSPSTIVEARWLVPKDRLPPSRKTGSWVVFLDNQQAADNLIDQGARVQALLLNARRYFSSPRQCRRCQRWGHLSYSCKAREQTCAHCGGTHAGPECPHPENKKCANCGGNHDAYDPRCSTRQAENLRAQSIQAGSSFYFSGADFSFQPFSSSSSPSLE